MELATSLSAPANARAGRLSSPRLGNDRAGSQ